MKIIISGLMLILSLSSYAASVEMACKVATMKVSEDGSDMTADKILMEQTLTIGDNDTVVILIEDDSARVVGEDDLQLSDDGKMIFAISQNVDPDGEGEIGLNVITSKLDFSRPNGFVNRSLMQVGNLTSINFTVIDFEKNIAMKCGN